MTKIEKYIEAKLHKHLIKFMIETNLSHKTIHRSSFLQLIRYLRSKAKTFDRTRLAKLINQRARKTKKTVLKDLKSNTQVSIACDVGISFNKLAFLRMTAYFIDKNGRYREILLAFKSLQKKHDEKKLANVVLKILMTHKLEKRLMMMTADNAFNNYILRCHLRRKLQEKKIE